MERIFARNSWWVIFLCFTSAIICGRLGAFLLRFDFEIPDAQTSRLLIALALDLPVKLAIFYAALLHRGWSSQLGIPDLKRIAGANVVASAVISAVILLVFGRGYPRSVYIVDLLLTFLAISAIRVIMRVALDAGRQRRKPRANRQNVLIYGAGRAAATLIRDLGANTSLNCRVFGLVDDDPLKHKEMLLGAHVLGAGRDLPAILERLRRRNIKIHHVLIAMPSATGRQMREAIAHCRHAGLTCKTLPGMSDLLTTKALSSQIRDIALEDLLGREPVVLDEAEIRAMIAGARVMVTGAAGSIGSELCRQIAGYGPAQLVMLDQAESDLFRIDLRLRRDHPELNIALELADIRSFDRVEKAVQSHHIDCIFHAAAYKHVPMMEQHVSEGAMNNIIGTWNLATVAIDNKVKSFVMISSDKAVNPTNVMGATKRAAELVVASLAEQGPTKFVSVRFGNVLGSNGSVVPTFKAQIAEGGPVTVTHPEVRRYFMTVREAVQLVLQASTMGRGSEVFVLDMGEPVRIVDLARNLISLAGYVPDKDIEIRFTGLRPGEKLYEELITEGENIAPTYHKKIKIFRSEPPRREAMQAWTDELRPLLEANDSVGIVAHLSRLIPEYVVSDTWAEAVNARIPRLPVVGGTRVRKAFRTAV